MHLCMSFYSWHHVVPVDSGNYTGFQYQIGLYNGMLQISLNTTGCSKRFVTLEQIELHRFD